jgi:hypothetical protein
MDRHFASEFQIETMLSWGCSSIDLRMPADPKCGKADHRNQSWHEIESSEIDQ